MDAAIASFPSPAPLPGQQRGALPRPPSRASARLAHRPPPTWPTPSRSAPRRCCAPRVRSNQRLETLLVAAGRTSAEDPQVALGIKDLDSTVTHLGPTVAQLTPAQNRLQLRDRSSFRNIGRPALRGATRTAPWQRFNHRGDAPPARRNPNKRVGQRRQARPTDRWSRTTCTPTRTRTPPHQARRRVSARPATRPTTRARPSSAMTRGPPRPPTEQTAARASWRSPDAPAPANNLLGRRCASRARTGAA